MMVEVRGIKMEVDERTATVVEKYKVGDKVRVLVKEYTTFVSYPGIIVGFNAFVKRPTIVVAYLKSSYSSVDLVFVDICEGNDDVEICPSAVDQLSIDKEHALSLFDRMLETKRGEMRDLEAKKRLFEERFAAYVVAQPDLSATDK